MVSCQLHASVAFFQRSVLYKLERWVYVLTRKNTTKIELSCRSRIKSAVSHHLAGHVNRIELTKPFFP